MLNAITRDVADPMQHVMCATLYLLNSETLRVSLIDSGSACSLHTKRVTACRSKGPCDVFDPWVRWERGQVGI